MFTKTVSHGALRFRAFLPAVGAVLAIGVLFLAHGPETRGPRRPSASVPSRQVSTPGAPAQPPSASANTLRFRWAEGDELAYDFRFRQEVEIAPSTAFLESMAAQGVKFQSPEAQQGSMELGATLRVRVYARLGEDWLVGYRIQGVRFAGAASSVRLEDEVLGRVDARGEAHELRFHAEVEARDRDVVKALLAARRVVLSDDDSPAWRTEEEEPLGVSQMEYAARLAQDGRAWRIERRRASIDVGTPGTSVRAEGGAEAMLETASGRITEGRLDEVVEIEGPEQPCTVRSVVKASYVLAGVGRVDRSEADRARTEFDQRRATGFRAEGAEEAGIEAHSRWDRDLAASLTLDGVLADLETASRSGRWKAEACDRFLELRALFLYDGGTVRRARTMLSSSGPYAEEVRITLIDALGAAGTAAAQEALISVAEDRTVPVAVREAALRSATEVEVPSDAFVAGLSRMVREADGEGLSSRAMEVLGIAAARMADAGRGAEAGEVVEELERGLAVSSDVGVRRAAILGLGNAALPRSEAALLGVAGSEKDEGVRAAAALALRAFSGAEVRETLDRLAASDPSALVRRAAQRALDFAANATEAAGATRE